MNPYLNKVRERTGMIATAESDGMNGLFWPRAVHRRLRCIGSNGMGWEHVSVSIPHSNETPTWAEMHAVKCLFWPDDQAVMQLHPPASDYVNNHPGCLHLWRPTEPGVVIPLPPSIMVGTKEANE